ncbi:MAG: hypothetical protein RMJ98_21795, partial [Myxococcales bacterium]|nr:hypothetical protein [Polyangiaceae bacterium]MDW8251938.1 hypothetical protein [Myxococcales bacterium]
MHSVPPPDFRYVGLTPGLSPQSMTAVAAGASAGLTGALLLAAGTDAASLALSTLAGGFVAFTLRQRGAFRLSHRRGAKPTAMAIVPWGVLIQPDKEQETRVLRWPGVQAIHVESIHTKDATGAPTTTWSLVTVETHRERLQGRALGQAPLERLMAHLPAYAAEASLPVALGLTGEERGGEGGFEPVVRELLGQVRLYLESADGVEALSLRAGTYRTMARWRACEETLALLREVLRGTPKEVDRRAFCAALAGELGATELLPDLLRLVTTAHSVTAGAARAAALRLGAEPTKAGALEELAPFLHEDDLVALSGWVSCGKPSNGGGRSA